MRRKRPDRIATGLEERLGSSLAIAVRRSNRSISAGSGLPREALRSRLMGHLTRRTATRYRSLDNARGYPRLRGPRWTWPGRTGRLVGKGGARGQRRCGVWEESGLGRWQLRAAVIVAAMGVLGGIAARADSARHFSFAYD